MVYANTFYHRLVKKLSFDFFHLFSEFMSVKFDMTIEPSKTNFSDAESLPSDYSLNRPTLKSAAADQG
jgi:hypothetical protein